MSSLNWVHLTECTKMSALNWALFIERTYLIQVNFTYLDERSKLSALYCETFGLRELNLRVHLCPNTIRPYELRPQTWHHQESVFHPEAQYEKESLCKRPNNVFLGHSSLDLFCSSCAARAARENEEIQTCRVKRSYSWQSAIHLLSNKSH